MMAFLLIGMAAADADAKVTYQAGSVKDDNKLNQYQDSLAIYKARLDSIQTLQKAYTAFDKYRLFTSSTFYNDVAQQKLGLNTEMKDSVSQEIDNALMNIYLKHPELIRVSEAEITEAGAVNQQITKPIVNTEKLVEKAPEAAVETVAAPEPEVVVKKPNFWTFKGDYAVQFLQNYVSGNWHKGGESNYSALASAVLEANYNNKQKVKWDNKLEMKLGFMTSRSDSLHEFKTSEDLIRLTSKLGLQATKHWYYTLQTIAETQFTRGYKSNDLKVYSDFLSLQAECVARYVVCRRVVQQEAHGNHQPFTPGLQLPLCGTHGPRSAIRLEGRPPCPARLWFVADRRPHLAACRKYQVEESSLWIHFLQTCGN